MAGEKVPSLSTGSSQGRGTTTRFGKTWSIQFLVSQGLWVWPVLIAAVLGGLGWGLSAAMDRMARARAASILTAVRDMATGSLSAWADARTLQAAGLAATPGLAEDVAAVVSGPAEGHEAARERYRARLEAPAEAQDAIGCTVVGHDLRVVLALNPLHLGASFEGGYREAFVRRILAGQAAVSRPFRSPLLLPDAKGEMRQGLPTMLCGAPVRGPGGAVLGALLIRIRPEEHLTARLAEARFFASSEAYAIDDEGRLLTQSRFEDELKLLGLVPDEPDATSVLTVELRDPGVDLTRGERALVRRSEQPLSHIVTELREGRDGVCTQGHRNYRGVPSFAAWCRAPKLDMGIVVDVTQEEAMALLRPLRLALFSLLTLLGLVATAAFVQKVIAARRTKELEQVREAGEYTLQELLGAGGMGAVYRARHARLRRPTAVKILDPSKVTPEAAQRFEREVQATCALTCPYTVAVYDYGPTREGGFYYAMEYLEGTDLENLVVRHGAQPEARVLHILRMASASLAEAHAAGLVHRDIKPANIMLTRRGVQHDVVKVVDFGLVKPAGSGEQAGLTAQGAIVGTPRYLAPEAIDHPESIDARADVHALGAVGYFLVTGHPPFESDSLIGLLKAVSTATPRRPTDRLGREVTASLEALLTRCMAKAPSARPRDAGELLDLLEGITDIATWTRAEASSWWQSHGGSQGGSGGSAAPTATGSGAPHKTAQGTGLGWLAAGGGVEVTEKLDPDAASGLAGDGPPA